VEYNLADLFEHAVDNFAEREYLVAGGKRRTYAEMEAREELLEETAANNEGMPEAKKDESAKSAIAGE